MRIPVAAAFIVAALAPLLPAEDIKDCFPRAQEVAGWVPSGEVDVYPGDKIYDFIDGAGEIYMKYSFDTAASAEYLNSSDSVINVEVYRMKTPEDAYGVFSYNRPGNADPLPFQQAAWSAGLTAGVWRNTSFVKVYALQDAPGLADAVKEFARILSLKLTGEGNLPLYFKVLEVDGFVEGSIRFARDQLPLKNLHFISEENVLDLGGDNVIVFADYAFKARRFKAFAALYPTRDAAAAAASKYARFLGSNPDAEAAWFRQSGRVLIGAWTGMKYSDTAQVQDVMYDTIENIGEQVRAYRLEK